MVDLSLGRSTMLRAYWGRGTLAPVSRPGGRGSRQLGLRKVGAP